MSRRINLKKENKIDRKMHSVAPAYTQTLNSHTSKQTNKQTNKMIGTHTESCTSMHIIAHQAQNLTVSHEYLIYYKLYIINYKLYNFDDTVTAINQRFIYKGLSPVLCKSTQKFVRTGKMIFCIINDLHHMTNAITMLV